MELDQAAYFGARLQVVRESNIALGKTRAPEFRYDDVKVIRDQATAAKILRLIEDFDLERNLRQEETVDFIFRKMDPNVEFSEDWIGWRMSDYGDWQHFEDYGAAAMEHLASIAFGVHAP